MSPKYTPTLRYLYRTLLLLLLCSSLAFVGTSQNAPHAGGRGVLRLRARVKEGDATKGLARKRFFLVKGTLEQNRSWLQEGQSLTKVSRDCYYRAAGASEELISWLKENDCESVYCREIRQDELDGPKAVPEFRQAIQAGESEFKKPDIAIKWLTVNLPTNVRDGFYRLNQERLRKLLTTAESTSGAAVQSVMTDRNGTAYFTDLEPGSYVLTNLLPVEIQSAFVSWNCEVQIKPGDIATERPFLIMNRQERNVKCVGVETPLPVCEVVPQ